MNRIRHDGSSGKNKLLMFVTVVTHGRLDDLLLPSSFRRGLDLMSLPNDVVAPAAARVKGESYG